MGLEGVQGPPGSQVFWLILLKLWCIKSESKGPITFLNMVINPKTLLIMQIFHLLDWYKLNHSLLCLQPRR